IIDTVNRHVLFDDKFLTVYPNVKNIDEIKEKLDLIFHNYQSNPDIELQVNKRTFYPFRKNDIREDLIISYQFSQVRELTVRQEIDASDLKDGISEMYSQVFGFKTTELTCFDSVIIDIERKILIILIDLARIMPRNELNVIHSNFSHFIKRELGLEIMEKYDFLSSPLDLFPCIQKFYDEKVDKVSGVTEIYFTTTEGTAHHEKLRGDSVDIRQVTYHESGVNGLKNTEIDGIKLDETITPYRISKKYYDRDVEISLNSSYNALSNINGSHLYNAFIIGSRSYEEIEFVLNKLLTLR
ncbi:TPA: hypothetical protein PKT84_003352, partial [Acinetobacter baumannii]|nr:hypothetical protein [Acinetobacter baumannii]HDI2513128.1 hypothetical protein [Acinetobacter baumannii]HDI2808930.1 hypothetical protein [Acinetobacter baumannii]HDI2813167.1 hypothetical protein [Acinetobacter baumannii]HDI2825226.1 hypothetical protein [Acinetobacter baumannii]